MSSPAAQRDSEAIATRRDATRRDFGFIFRDNVFIVEAVV
jgi:hypothetical protein